jgi:hypothetical protein
MTTFTIYHGASKPIKAVGKHQVKLLDFAYRYKGWHTYGTDSVTMRAIKALHAKGCLDLNEFGQFRFTYPTI